MKPYSTVPLIVFVGVTLAKDVFEPLDFNVTEADKRDRKEAIARSMFSCRYKCATLSLIFDDKTLVNHSIAYDAFTSGYWSAQTASVELYCIFKPTQALDVSTAILLSRLTQCPSAVKGGGHTGFPGASSIEGGITITLEDLNEIMLSNDKRTAGIGPGNRWGDVYSKLGAENLTVVGGRASDVVMGLVHGGGILHHSNLYGFACDNVAAVEVVTASGVILAVTPTQFPDLYFALRGGGNNFGVVTKFILETVPQGLMWGGTRIHLQPDYPALIDAFASMAENAASDPKAVQILSFAVTAGSPAAQIQLKYLQPVNEADPPEISKGYLGIPSVRESTINRTLASDADILNDQMPAGHHYSFWAATFKLDRSFMAWMQGLHQKNVGPLPDQSSLTFQAFTVPALSQMSKKEGNALGLSPNDGALMHVLLYMLWDDATKDDALYKAASAFIDAAKAEAKARGLYHKYVYMNYAGPYQNVMPSYGEEILAKLNKIVKKYDPKAVLRSCNRVGTNLKGHRMENWFERFKCEVSVIDSKTHAV